MKSIISISISLFILKSYLCQTKEFSIIGKWQETEHHGSDGAKAFVNKIKNGRVLIFDNKNGVKDEKKNKGTYQLKGDSLHIFLAKDNFYYRFNYKKNNTHKLNLTPVTEKYEIICDEGCASVFERKE
jgi:hypothetical protein